MKFLTILLPITLIACHRDDVEKFAYTFTINNDTEYSLKLLCPTCKSEQILEPSKQHKINSNSEFEEYTISCDCDAPVKFDYTEIESEVYRITENSSGIYAAGYEYASEKSTAKYWKDGRGVSLTTPPSQAVVSFDEASSISVSGNDVYVSGIDGASIVYWKNGERVTLGTSIGAGNYPDPSSIITIGTDVYVAWSISGKYQNEYNFAMVTKNNQKTTLEERKVSDGETLGLGIAVSGSDVFVSGKGVSDQTYTAPDCCAKYWKNGVSVSLPGGTMATGIAVSGDDVYVVGYSGNIANSRAILWKNGQKIEITNTNGAVNGVANAVFNSGSDVYIAFTEGGMAKYWKNGEVIELDLGEATSIMVVGTDVYVGGYHFGGGYWKNRTWNPLKGATKILSIFVKE
ncbi:MAG TPA: hypothetical protein VFU05_06100 [Cyclobacteriaceae bacterium]|nr:hypothetical protein [Cyclobacteriaceae bacterium]